MSVTTKKGEIHVHHMARTASALWASGSKNCAYFMSLELVKDTLDAPPSGPSSFSLVPHFLQLLDPMDSALHLQHDTMIRIDPWRSHSHF